MITVVIPTADREHLLSEALRSVAEQTYQDVDVVVANDGGRVPEQVLRRWRAHLPIHLVELPERLGAAAARNAALTHAHCEYVAFLDDDDLYLPTHLEMAAKALDGGADFVYTGAVVVDRRVDGLPAEYESLHRKAYEFTNGFLLVANFLHTGSVVTRNFRDTDLRFDESLPVCEDWDMWIALTRAYGDRVAFVDELTTVYHQVAGAQGLVAEAQQLTPSPFSVTRDRIHEKWPSPDDHVTMYRDWLTQFEVFRNTFIAGGGVVPTQLFDRVLSFLHPRFCRGETVQAHEIPALFESAWPSR
ncbi:MAG: glycosyltransferase family 2 protein [Umezawaea sp.]